ncbi:MAG: AAA family ATPase [Nannocystaceae bacterium]
MDNDENERKPPQVRRIRVQNFRCFEDVELEPLSKVNILVGPNNVGKTALTLALRRFVRLDLNFHRRVATPGGVGVAAWHHSMNFVPEDEREAGAKPSITVEVEVEVEGVKEVTCLEDLDHADSELRVKKQRLAGRIASRLVYVPSNRRIPSELQRHDPTVFEERRYDGSDLLVDLIKARLSLEGNSRARDVERFASDILGAELTLHPRVDPPSLLVSIGGDPPRHVYDLGEGITQSLAIAGAVASVDDPFLVIEDPELGLHPTLQRRLVDFLINLPGAQALLATHSNHILDIVHDELAVFRLLSDANGRRTIKRVEPSAVQMLSELGVRPSSIAASNCVIWVEGPSDAIYLRCWLAAAAPDLKEWHDFSFSFLGGSLLAHVGVDGEEGIDEDGIHIVSLMRVNPSFYLVADSDRSGTSDPLGKKYLQRVHEKIDSGRLWITQGYEIESYISDRILITALGGGADDIQPGQVSEPGLRLEERLTRRELPASKAREKVALARKCIAVEGGPDWVLDLKDRVEGLVTFIRRCRAAIPAAGG